MDDHQTLLSLYDTVRQNHELLHSIYFLTKVILAVIGLTTILSFFKLLLIRRTKDMLRESAKTAEQYAALTQQYADLFRKEIDFAHDVSSDLTKTTHEVLETVKAGSDSGRIPITSAQRTRAVERYLDHKDKEGEKNDG